MTKYEITGKRKKNPLSLPTRITHCATEFCCFSFFFLLLKEAVVDSKEEPHSVSPLTFPPPLVGSSFSLFFPPSSFFFLSPSILTYFTLGVLFSLYLSSLLSLSLSLRIQRKVIPQSLIGRGRSRISGFFSVSRERKKKN